MFRTILILTVCAAYPVTGVNNVTVSKCCNKNEILSNDKKCIDSTNPDWTFIVYSPSKKGYVYKNEIPSNWHLKFDSKPNCLNPSLVVNQMNNYVPFHNGSLWIPEYGGRLFHPDSFCIDYKSVLFCVDEPPTIWVKECCGSNGIFSTTNNTCIHMKSQSYKIEINHTLREGFPSCNEVRFGFAGKLHEAEMRENGTLWIPHHKTLLPVANYCLEHVLENTGRSPSIMVCREHLNFLSEPLQEHGDLRFTMYPIALALSAVFLAATLAAGAILPASHHVLHWRCQTNHVACLLVGDVLLCITQLSGKMEPTFCTIIAVSMHFLFLAAFFWLNTMCFNIWWTFRDLRPQSVEKSQERCRLRLYEVYAWGVPLVIAGTGAILDSLPDNPGLLKPRFGVDKCWFHNTKEILTFFYGPIGVLLIINLALFVLTARELTCGLWKREVVKSTSERAALGRICMKLVVVMGVSWIAEVMSWSVGGPQEVWYVTDLINCLQGVFIFIVVGCQPQVFSAVKRLWCLRKHRENGTAGTNHSSSQGLPSMGGDTVTNNSVTNTTKSVPLETSC